MTAQQTERTPTKVLPVVMKELGCTRDQAREWFKRNFPKGGPVLRSDVMAKIERTKKLRRPRPPIPGPPAPAPDYSPDF